MHGARAWGEVLGGPSTAHGPRVTSSAAPYSPRAQVTPGQLLQLASQLEASQPSSQPSQVDLMAGQSSSQPSRAGALQSQLKMQLSPLQLPPQKPWSHEQLSPGQTSASLRATSSGTVGCAREQGGAGQGRQTSRHRRLSPKRPAAADRVRHRLRPRSRRELPPSVAARPCQRSLVGENARLPHRAAPFGCSGASSRWRRRAERGGQASAGHALRGDLRYADA